ncbi:amidohydrolase family protein [Actinotalea sp. K2]|uniref:amidohydrolase n=1 Tax=Actinotalea sp. K2 TaxID=2939438 RepID=UPI0027E12157|nr:amidohydrolase family protein [Actinotalea sp. K2]
MSGVGGGAASARPLLLRGVRVVDTLHGASPEDAPVDVLLRDGLVAAVGPRLVEPGVEVLDLDGRWLMPGLWDAHVHMDQWALARQRLDLAGATSAAHAATLIAARLRDRPLPEGAMLVAHGFRDGLWDDAPTADLLDRAIAAAGLPPSPVVAVSSDLHCGWLSSPALVRLGSTGHETGLLREAEWFAVAGGIDEVTGDVLDRWVHDAARAAAARGVVGIVELEIADNISAWARRIREGSRSLRVEAGVWPQHLDHALALGLASGDLLPGLDGGLLALGPLKVISDGSLNTRTAFCHDPYPGLSGPHAHGMLTVPPEELVPLMARAHGGGLSCAIHAIGDHANTLALDAFEATGARGSIEHAQLLTVPDAERMAALGVVASIQPEHAMDDRDVADRHWVGRTDRAFAYATLARTGARLALGSDAPVAPLDPWVAIDAAVHRTRGGRPAWHPEQRLDRLTALHGSVRTHVGAGQPADLVVLDTDPRDPATALRQMPVVATMLAGRWTHTTL